MAQSTLAPDSVTEKAPPVPPLKHFVCPCQVVLEVGGVAYCGTKVAGRAQSAAGIPPMHLCVLCGDFKTDQRPCPICGRPATGW